MNWSTGRCTRSMREGCREGAKPVTQPPADEYRGHGMQRSCFPIEGSAFAAQALETGSRGGGKHRR
jgi:hypothetical protein